MENYIEFIGTLQNTGFWLVNEGFLSGEALSKHICCCFGT